MRAAYATLVPDAIDAQAKGPLIEGLGGVKRLCGRIWRCAR